MERFNVLLACLGLLPFAQSFVGAEDAMTTKHLTVSSPAFAQNSLLPPRYSGEGQDVSPPIEWTEVPPAAKALALVVDDPDAPSPEPWVHWVLYNISPREMRLPEAVPVKLNASGVDDGAIIVSAAMPGLNSWNKVGYKGPFPPIGHGLHHYHFRLYALDAELSFVRLPTKRDLEIAMKGHVLAEGETIGVYQR